MNIKVNRNRLKDHFDIVHLPALRRPSSIAQFTTDVMCDRYGLSPYSINNGYCFIWAYLFWSIAKDKMEVRFKSNHNHVVVEVDGKFYDSEHILGERRLSKMEFFEARRADEAEDYDITEMVAYWSRNGCQAWEFRNAVKVSAVQLYRCAIKA